jgi:hypothetical protein
LSWSLLTASHEYLVELFYTLVQNRPDHLLISEARAWLSCCVGKRITGTLDCVALIAVGFVVRFASLPIATDCSNFTSTFYPNSPPNFHPNRPIIPVAHVDSRSPL